MEPSRLEFGQIMGVSTATSQTRESCADLLEDACDVGTKAHDVSILVDRYHDSLGSPLR